MPNPSCFAYSWGVCIRAGGEPHWIKVIKNSEGPLTLRQPRKSPPATAVRGKSGQTGSWGNPSGGLSAKRARDADMGGMRGQALIQQSLSAVRLWDMQAQAPSLGSTTDEAWVSLARGQQWSWGKRGAPGGRLAGQQL